MVSLSLYLAVLSLASSSYAAPQHPFPAPDREFNPLKHLSAISPFYIPSQTPTPLPKNSKLTRVSLLIRHSSILGNDDEYEQSMYPFIKKIKDLQGNHSDILPSSGEWSFLREWETPIIEERLEVLSKSGKRDAKALGKYIRNQYESLFPSKSRKPSTDLKKKSKPTYKVWTASSSRDIESAEAYIKGAFPSHQSGEDGDGDGEIVQLVKVPNKARDWDRSLTPHKACDTFEKESSLIPANKWLSVYAPKVIERISKVAPGLAGILTHQDILGMQMLCGYESIALSPTISPFCHVFPKSEWLDFEYHQDIRFHYMLGYGQNLSAYLGMPWARTALHLLEGKDGEEFGLGLGLRDGESEGEDGLVEVMKGKKKGDGLPKPRVPPNATHTQLLHASFTHRESPGFVAVFLNLFNETISPKISASTPPSLDVRPSPEERAWRTSHLVSFLGHVALERFETRHSDHGDEGIFVRLLNPVFRFIRYLTGIHLDMVGHMDNMDDMEDVEMASRGKKGKGDYVRAVVNGKQVTMGGCNDGIEGSCKWSTFVDWVGERAERWGDWASVCEKRE